MKSYKITQIQIDTIKEGLARFINYVNEYCMEYASYYSDMDKTNEQTMQLILALAALIAVFFIGIFLIRLMINGRKQDYFII